MSFIFLPVSRIKWKLKLKLKLKVELKPNENNKPALVMDSLNELEAKVSFVDHKIGHKTTHVQ